MFLRLGEMCFAGRCVGGQIPFNAGDQVWNADRLGQKGMPLDPETRSCLRFRDQTREKNNRRSVQCRIRFNLGRRLRRHPFPASQYQEESDRA